MAVTVHVNSQANIPLKGVVVTVPGFSPVTCPEGSSSLAVGATLVCSTSLTYTQDMLEAGDKTYTASMTAVELTAPATSKPLSVVVQAAPRLAVDVMAGNCTKPTRAGEQGCSLHALLCRAGDDMLCPCQQPPCAETLTSTHACMQCCLMLCAHQCASDVSGGHPAVPAEQL